METRRVGAWRAYASMASRVTQTPSPRPVDGAKATKKDAAARGSPPRRKWSCSKTWTCEPPTAARGLRETLRKSYMLSMRENDVHLECRNI